MVYNSYFAKYLYHAMPKDKKYFISNKNTIKNVICILIMYFFLENSHICLF